MTKAFDLGAMISTNTAANDIRQIPCDMLIPYHSHRFELYTGERLNDMVESIRKNGVLMPIVVQPAAEGKYEILIGHNRWNASKLAGNATVPAIIRNGLTEKEAEMFVTESNIMQRGFLDLKISEQAAVIADRYKDMFDIKKLTAIREELNSLNTGIERTAAIENAVYKPMKSEASEPKIVTVGRLYGLSKNTIARLLRINTLTDDLKFSVDIDILSVRAAVELSYISPNAQKAVFEHYRKSYLQNNQWCDAAPIDLKTAQKIREMFSSFDGSPEQAEKLLSESTKAEDKPKTSQKPKKIRYEVYSKYFDDTVTEDSINDILDKALAMYFESIKNDDTEESE